MPRIDAPMLGLDLRNRTGLPDTAFDAAVAIGAAVIGVTVALVLHHLLYRLLMRLAARSDTHSDDIVLAHLRRPTRWAMAALGLVLAARETPLLADVWQRIAGFVMPALVGWIALAAFRSFVEASCALSGASPEEDEKLRRKRTRLAIFSRIVTFVIVFVTVGLMLLSIPGVREIGVTLIASAGIAGLAVGAAAQPALKSLIAGIQMALTEPISIGDTVHFENGDGGTVEDIRSSFVVVRTWDERRLVIPTSKFLDEPFENWSRNGTALFGEAYLHLDPSADVAQLRAEFDRLTDRHPLWDKRKKSFQVTDMTAITMVVRMVVSATTPGELFDLRADLREGMLAFIRQQQPKALSRQRTDAVEVNNPS